MQISKELIERYHLGLCSPEEQHSVEQWLESDEVEMSFPEDNNLTALEEKGWKKLSSRYHILNESKPGSMVKLQNYQMIWRLVACMLCVLGFAALDYAYTMRGSNSHNYTIVYKEIKTAKGQKLSVTLPDGTVAWLNSESIIRFPEGFKGRLRELEFSGEAYFSVEKDPSKPFIVHTANTKIKVLGTKFNLRALTSEKTTSVVVEEGRVQFSGDSDKQQLVLTANKRGIFEKGISSASIMKEEEVYATKYIGWKNNQLLLDNVTMEEAVLTLERWYNVDIEIKRFELHKERYTGNFDNPTLLQVLESMGFAVKFRYVQHGQHFILY